MPEVYPTIICFGGRDMKTAYITLLWDRSIGRDELARARACSSIQD
ncbi:MAG: hypothetical protein JO320_28320 [Alphaproteobacteria bacterium]|nr:hypothetical protein [Alphaproteobacteria bacterium]